MKRLVHKIVPVCLVGGAFASAAAMVGAAQTRFPSGYEGYHTYAEMSAELDAIVEAFPGIASRRSIGRSHEGREIWMLKISDNVRRDEPEPEVLIESLLHAREHLATEMALYVARLLTVNYRKSPATDLQRRVSAIVKSREIWIVPMANPDGSEYDIGAPDGAFRRWRKNRQPIPGASALGVDLNRNWGYQWGCCQGSSANPASIEYRGPRPWFAPEVVALRDFVNSRVRGAKQQITEAISLHTYGEQVMWPYGYTTADLPKSMTADDLAALRAIGEGVANRNGYAPQQMSDLYVFDGNVSDWLYHEHRIMALTIEMFPQDDGVNRGGFYPGDSVIGRETRRNRDAVLWFLEQADCPHRAAGMLADCGPLYDDFEVGRGWEANPHRTDNATGGHWVRAIPFKSGSAAGVKQLASAVSGEAVLVTGTAPRASANAADVDGTTSIRSPAITLGGSSSQGWRLTFSYTFAHDRAATGADYLRVSVDGSSAILFERGGSGSERNASWATADVDLDAYAGQTLRLLIQAGDGDADNLVEAAIDDMRVYQAP